MEKENFQLEDYPIRYMIQPNLKEGETKPWIAQVVDWWSMVGVGKSKEEAYLMLKNNFEDFKKSNILPSPGKKNNSYRSSATQMRKYKKIAEDFFYNILDKNYSDCFVSDDSSIFDFIKDESKVLKAINDRYNLSLKDLGNGNILEILRKIIP